MTNLGDLLLAKADEDIERGWDEMKRNDKNTDNTLKDYTKIVVETDEENPKKIAEITSTDVTPADGYRVRLTPNYD